MFIIHKPVTISLKRRVKNSSITPSSSPDIHEHVALPPIKRLRNISILSLRKKVSLPLARETDLIRDFSTLHDPWYTLQPSKYHPWANFIPIHDVWSELRRWNSAILTGFSSLSPLKILPQSRHILSWRPGNVSLSILIVVQNPPSFFILEKGGILVISGSRLHRIKAHLISYTCLWYKFLEIEY